MTLKKYFVTIQSPNEKVNNAFERVQKEQLKDADPLHASYRFHEGTPQDELILNHLEATFL